MRAENTAVAVRFVEHHVAQPAQEGCPLPVVAQNRVVEHVRGGEDEVGVLADPAALTGRGVAVVACRVQSGQVVGGEGGELVGGECFRRGNVENVRSIIEVFHPGIRGS